MTRIFTDGAEMRDSLFWDTTYVTSIQSSSPFASPYYYFFDNSGGYVIKYLPAPLSECYCRVRTCRPYPVSSMRVISFRTSTTEVAWVGWNGGFWALGVGGAFVATSTVFFSTQWCLVEAYFKEADAPNGRFTLRVDGTDILDYTGDTKPSSGTTFDNIYMTAGGNGQDRIDDIALNDTNNLDGKNDNSWCNDGIIIKIIPSGSGTYNNWLNSGSTSGSSNYGYIDEYPKDDDTTYIYCSGSLVGTQDEHRMSSFDGYNKTVTRIYAEGRARKSVADLTSLKIGYLPSGSTTQVSGSLTLTTSYTRIVGDEVLVNPATSASWTESDINSIQFVSEI